MGDITKIHIKKPLNQKADVRLADFIRDNTKAIVDEWETFARSLKPAANDMTPHALRNHIHQILDFIVNDIDTPQTHQEQVLKSKGEKEKSSKPSAAETHAALRLAGGFNIDQMVSEWRALRASIIKLWGLANTQMNSGDMVDLTRFNESIDQELAEAVSHYTEKVGTSKDMFVAILGHDLRSPLGAISMCAQLLLNIGSPKEQEPLTKKQTMLITQIFESTSRVTEIVTDLLDVTQARFGSGLPVIKAPMDMAFVSRLVVQEMRVAHPTRTILLELSEELKGNWDKARIGQVFSNLLGNAIQYSFIDSDIEVKVTGSAEEVILSVHNQGIPIPPDKMVTIFEALTRVAPNEFNNSEEVNLGLGLYITQEIVLSHGGTIEVTSTEEEGTTFIARFPRS